MIRNALRFILRIPLPKINRDQALSISEGVCEKKVWKICRPRVQEGLKTWKIWINSESKSSPMIEINNQTGEVSKIASIRR